MNKTEILRAEVLLMCADLSEEEKRNVLEFIRELKANRNFVKNNPDRKR